MVVPETSGHLKLPDGQLFYERTGEGPPIVWIHAAIADRRMWDREFETYAKDHTLVRYDVRGFGRSSPAKANYSDSSDLRTLLDHLQLGPVTLVGCSNGGRIALDFAVTDPDRVRSLLLVAPGVSGWEPSLQPEGQAVYEKDMARSAPIPAAWAAGRREEALEKLQAYWASAVTGPALPLVRRMMQENAVEIFTDASARFSQPPEPPAALRLGEVRARTVLLYGDHDEPTLGYFARWIVGHVPEARLVDVPGADHLINLSRPAAFDSALNELMQ